MNKSIVAIVAASALAATTIGYAGGAVSAPVDNAAGFYVNGNVGYGHSNVTLPKHHLTDVSLKRNSFAWSAALGYQFNRNLAVEAGYMALPHYRVNVANVVLPGANTASTVHTDLHTGIIDVAVKGIYPISEQFDVFAKVGLGYTFQSETGAYKALTGSDLKTKHRIIPVFGLGVDYNVSQNLAITLQGIATTRAGDDNGKLGNGIPASFTGLVGLTYKFI